MTTPDPSREAFEKHVLTENGIYVRGIGWISRNELGDYVATDTQRRWLTWQAAIAHKEADCGGGQNSHESLQTRIDAGSTVGPNPGWQPIETAPSYTTILVLGTSGMVVAYKDSYGDWKADGVDVTYDMAYTVLQIGKLTHWAPLPAAPKQEGST